MDNNVREADNRWLDDPRIFRVGQLPAHSDHKFFQDEESYRSGQETLQLSLNGDWIFHYSKNPMERPEDFYQEDFDCSSFDSIQVPCHIEMAGFDTIHYSNTNYPWEGKVYRRPDQKASFSNAWDNAVGSYIKYFDLPELLQDKRTVLCLEGVEQAAFVWLNGQFLGYTEDSFTVSEFDLTDYIRQGKNKLAVEVYKRSTAGFLEDQDFFRFFGIFRNVRIYAVPSMHVENITAKPVLKENNKSGELGLLLKITSDLSNKGEVEILLCDNNKILYSTKKQTLYEKETQLSFQSPELEIIPWSNELAKLYQLVVRLYDQKGELVEIACCDIGFRRIEIINKVICLNGKRLILKGVNRHEWSPDKGRAIGQKEMETDLVCMKRNHINAVRTCHYPDQLLWYQLCDEQGIYVMSETNLETHGSWTKSGQTEPSWNVPGSYPEWREVVVDRARTHYEMLKNHPSILFWSLGNESYCGENIKAMQEYFKEQKDGRPVHYEGVFWNKAYRDQVSDLESQMYTPPGKIREYLENQPDKPFIVCEFMHDMGNSLGGFGSYMKLLEDYEMYQGGFIWDFIDQAVWVTDVLTGKKVLRYGGDFGDRPSDYEFSGNGLLFADRTEKPAMQEVKYYYGSY